MTKPKNETLSPKLFPRKLIVSPDDLNETLPREQRDAPTITLQWDKEKGEVFIAAQTLPTTRSGRNTLGELKRLNRRATDVLTVMGNAHMLQESLKHMKSLTPVHIEILESVNHRGPASIIDLTGITQKMDQFLPAEFGHYIYGSSADKKSYAWAPKGFDPEKFGSPYLTLVSGRREPTWTISHVGEENTPYRHGRKVFSTGTVETAKWNDVEGLKSLVDAILSHDPEYAETFALLENGSALTEATKLHSIRQQGIAALAAFSRPKDRVKPRVITDMIADVSLKVSEKQRAKEGTESDPSWYGTKVGFYAKENPISVLKGRTWKRAHALVSILVTERSVPSLSEQDPELFAATLKDFCVELQENLNERNLGTLVFAPGVDNRCRFFVVKNIELVEQHIAVCLDLEPGTKLVRAVA